MIVTRKYSFNSALNKLNPDTGKFDTEAFREMILPIRGKVMDKDGMYGCSIARYAMEVSFLGNVTDTASVDAHVIGVIMWAAAQSDMDFFPFLAEEGKDLKIVAK